MVKQPSILIVLSLLIVFGSGVPTEATLQTPDEIVIEDQTCDLEVEVVQSNTPLEYFFIVKGQRDPFHRISQGFSTGNYRGHIATWRIEDERLFLERVVVEQWETGSMYPTIIEVPLKRVLGHRLQQEPVAAEWFTGVFRISCPTWSSIFHATPIDEPMGPQEHFVVKVTDGYVEEILSVDRWHYWRLLSNPIKPDEEVDEVLLGLVAAHKEYDENLERWQRLHWKFNSVFRWAVGCIFVGGGVFIGFWYRMRKTNHAGRANRLLWSGIGLMVLGIVGIWARPFIWRLVLYWSEFFRG